MSQHRGDYTQTEAGTGGMWPQAKDVWGPMELGEARKAPPLEPLVGVWPCDTLILANITNFGHLASRTIRE